MKQFNTIGLDLAKNVIQVHAVNKSSGETMNRRFTRSKALRFLANVSPFEIGLEACGGAHHFARKLMRMGHQVRMIPAQYVKPYVMTNKNDAADARAVYEAMSRDTMRFVTIKSEPQQSAGLSHKVREQLMKQRTQTINAIRGHCMELGVTCPKGPRTSRVWCS